MKNNPDTAEMDAVKNDRFIVLSGLAMFPSLENTDVVEQIARFSIKITVLCQKVMAQCVMTFFLY